jgi:1-acyl-sn-glycerol-3-phosphate acyltransferase
MLKAKENTESFFIWILLMIAPFISLVSSKGALATVYAVRAILCTGLLLLLMFRIETQNQKSVRKSKEIR